MAVYRVGILGFGFIGKVHAYGYATLPFFCDPLPLEARIARVCTSHADTARRAAAMLGAEGVTDFRRITEDPAIDIVHVCTPNHLHKDALLSAMAHGKHIYCDKPLVATPAEADEIERALGAYRGTAQMTFQSRFFPATLRAKQLVDEGRLGRIHQFRAGYLHGGSARPEAPLKWKLAASAGGGVIADLASHVLDLVHHLLGDFEALSAATHVAYPQRPSADDPARLVPVDAEDCVTALARMRCGALGVIEATKLATGAEDELRLEVHGSDGAIRFDLMDPHHLGFYDATAPDQPAGGQRGWTQIDTGRRYPAPSTSFPSPKAAMGWLRGHAECLAHFLRCVARGEPAQPGLAQGVHVQRLMDCLRRSAGEGGWIRVSA